MKHLPPTLREDNRYLRYKIHSDSKQKFSDIVEALWNTTVNYLGEKDASKANPWIIKNLFDEDAQEGAIKINREMETEFRAAIALVDQIGGEKVFITVEQVAGTVKSLEGLEK